MAMIEASSRPATAGERLGDRWRRLRNRVIGSPGFQRWAARFPFTRPVARQRARALFDLTAGFVYSQTAYACVRSGLLEHLAEGPAPVAAIARRAELPPAGAERLLRAAVALGLAERAGDGRYALGQQGAALLGAPGVAAMIEHHQLLYADLSDPLALLRRGGGGGALAGYWPYASGREGEAAPYSALMSASQAMVAAQVLDAYPLARHRRLLDVGGGDGTFLRAVAARAPGLELALFDLPPVAAAARARFAADGLTVGVSGGSFLDDPLPEGADAISLVRVVHDHDDAAVITLLRAARRALPPGGVLLLAEPMAGTRGAEPMAAYFDLYLLAMGSGRPRTSGELRAMLRAAGFTRARQVATSMPLIAQLIVASA